MAKRPVPVQQPGKPEASPKKRSDAESLIVENRKARHDYHIDETLETGLVLKGTEVKALREGKVVLQDAYGIIQRDEMFLLNCQIQPYSHGSVNNHPLLRQRKLLAHRREIERLDGKVKEKGYTLVPLKMYWKNGRAKVLMGLGRGKKEFDRRDDIKQREHDREMGRAIRRGRR
jgi:SsrA-binding protein